MSAIQIVVRATLALFATGMAILVFMPVMFDLAIENGYWDTAPTNQLAIRDNIYNIFLLIGPFMMGAIILWAFLASTRKTADEFI